jgi:hypothetical protein
MKKNIKKLFFLSSVIVFASCTVTRKYAIEEKNLSQVAEFYNTKAVSSFIYPQNILAVVKLDSLDKISIPSNTVFDENGIEIMHFNDKLCADHTLAFLKDYKKDMPLKLGKLTIKEYLKHFKASDSSIDFDALQNQKKIRVFVNTGSQADKWGVNQEAFEIYNRFKDQYTVVVVNLDKLKEWEPTETK